MDPKIRRNVMAFTLLGIGFLLVVVGIFRTWWSVDVSAASSQGATLNLFEFTARPFATDVEYNPLFGEQEELRFLRLEEGLDEHVNWPGVLVIAGAGCLLVSILIFFSGYLGLLLPFWLFHLPTMLGLVLGATGLLIPMLTWPERWDAFFGETVSAFGLDPGQAEWLGTHRSQESSDGALIYQYAAGSGWWMSLIGFVGMPILSIVAHLAPQPGPPQLPPEDFRVRVEPPPPLPIPKKTEPPPGPSFKTHLPPPRRPG